jgi:NADH-quinone oxidoreductase subunit K
MEVPAGNYLVLAAALFTVGVVGVLVRRSLIVIFMSIELMLNSVILTIVTFSRIHGNLDGQVVSFFIMVVAAAEVTVGLALIVNLYRLKASTDADDVDALRA